MLAKVHSAAVLGIESYPIEIEVNYSGWGKPNVVIMLADNVGYGDIKLNGFLLLTYSIDTVQGWTAWWAVRYIVIYLDNDNGLGKKVYQFIYANCRYQNGISEAT